MRRAPSTDGWNDWKGKMLRATESSFPQIVEVFGERRGCGRLAELGRFGGQAGMGGRMGGSGRVWKGAEGSREEGGRGVLGRI